MKIDNADLRNFATVAVGALYVWVGIKRQEAPDWAFDAVLVLGIMVIASVLYKLFVSRKSSRTKAPRKWDWAGARPAITKAPAARAASVGPPVAPKLTSSASAIANGIAGGASLRSEPHGASEVYDRGESGPMGLTGGDTLAEWTSSVAPGSKWM